MRSERSSALSSTISISPTATASPQESDSRKKRNPPARQNSKPPLSTGSDKILNGTYRTKDGSPTSGSSKERSSIPLVSKLSVGSNLSGDILTRVKYSPSSISMVSADLSHVTSLVSSDTLTDVSSLPGDIGSLSKSDYEDYECMEGENDETFDITNTDVDESGDHPHDDTIICCTDDDRDGEEEEEEEDAEEDDSPQTIEEPRTPVGQCFLFCLSKYFDKNSKGNISIKSHFGVSLFMTSHCNQLQQLILKYAFFAGLFLKQLL